MPRLVGIGKTSDLLLTGRKVSGSEAAAMGLVLRGVPRADLMEEARTLGQEIAIGSSPTAVTIVKRMTWGRMIVKRMTWGRMPDDGELYKAIYEDDNAIGWAIHGPDAAEGNKAFFEKRRANWVDVESSQLPGFGKRNATPSAMASVYC
jgi:enoyl-CoA hydratase/carnithine racemase